MFRHFITRKHVDDKIDAKNTGCLSCFRRLKNKSEEQEEGGNTDPRKV